MLLHHTHRPAPLKRGVGLCVLTLLAGVHIILVALGAFQVESEQWGPLGKVLHLYGELTGSGSGYAFFAPGVGYQIRAEFDVMGQGKEPIVATFLNKANSESDLRTGNIISSLSRNSNDAKTRRAMVASWAGKVFSQYPSAKEVIVRVESFMPVPLKQYRNGERARWKPFYRTRFLYESRRRMESTQ